MAQGLRNQLRGCCLNPGCITQREDGSLKQGSRSRKREGFKNFSVIEKAELTDPSNLLDMKSEREREGWMVNPNVWLG